MKVKMNRALSSSRKFGEPDWRLSLGGTAGLPCGGPAASWRRRPCGGPVGHMGASLRLWWIHHNPLFDRRAALRRPCGSSPRMPPCCHPCCRDSAKPPPGNPGARAGLTKCKTDLTKCKTDLTKCKTDLTLCQFPSLQQSQNRKWLIELAGAVSPTGPRQTTLLEIMRTLLAGIAKKRVSTKSVSEPECLLNLLGDLQGGWGGWGGGGKSPKCSKMQTGARSQTFSRGFLAQPGAFSEFLKVSFGAALSVRQLQLAL